MEATRNNASGGTFRDEFKPSSVRYAAELGYEVTLAKDATAAFTWEQMTATLETNLPNYAEAIITTEELLQQLSAHTPA